MEMEKEDSGRKADKLRKKAKAKGFLKAFGIIIVSLAIIAYVAFDIWVWVKYGNAPRDETPNWVWWFMWNR
jgi:hypothetical protein